MSSVRPHEVGEITLGGISYPFRTPKIAVVLSALIRMKGKPEIEQMQILLEAQAKWIRLGVGKEVWGQLERRLEDEDDVLDWPDLAEAFQGKVGDSANRPTTSSSASPTPQQMTTSSEDGPRIGESIFGG